MFLNKEVIIVSIPQNCSFAPAYISYLLTGGNMGNFCSCLHLTHMLSLARTMVPSMYEAI